MINKTLILQRTVVKITLVNNLSLVRFIAFLRSFFKIKVVSHHIKINTRVATRTLINGLLNKFLIKFIIS